MTRLSLATVLEPPATRIELHWDPAAAADVVAAWQTWAPAAPDGLTLNVSVVSGPRPDEKSVVGFGASDLPLPATRALLGALPRPSRLRVRAGLAYSGLKRTLADLTPHVEPGGAASVPRVRSELFRAPIRDTTLTTLLETLRDRTGGWTRRLTFTALGGAYDHVHHDASAYPHRGALFNLEHAGSRRGSWVDRSWEIAHADGSGGTYVNFPDPALEDPAAAHHGAHLARLLRVADVYDPDRVLDPWRRRARPAREELHR